MVSARQAGHWALYALGACVGVVLVVRLGVGIYLSTDASKAMVAHQIESRIGMPVEVRSVRLGLFTSSISMRVLDPAAPDPGKAEVFAVGSATADVSLFSLVRGHLAPKKVDLQGANLTLHVGVDGKVLTTLPKVPEGAGTGGGLPIINLSGAQITIRQDGRPEFTLHGLTATVDPQGDDIKLTGAMDDPAWSKWTMAGTINRAAKTGSVQLATEDGPLTMDRLGSVPFVPASVWAHVRPDGRGAIALQLMVGSDHEVHYSVETTPHGAALTLPDANVTLRNLTGVIRVAGKKVELSGTRAELAGGTLAVDGNCDFGPEPTIAQFKVVTSGLDLRQLPAEWELPREFEGKLKGEANLVLRIHADGKIEPQGGGDGTIEGAKIEDIPVSISIHLGSDGKQYRFQRPGTPPRKGTKTESGNRFGHKTLVRCVGRASPPARHGVSEEDPTVILSGTHPGTTELVRHEESPGVVPQGQKPDPPKKDDQPTTVEANVKLRDVEIGELLEKLKVKIAYKVSGKVSAEVSMSVPLTRVSSQAAYQFTGKVSSPALRLEGLTIRNLSAQVVYQDGKLTLSHLVGTIDQPGQPTAPPGTFRGTATVGRNPPGDVAASLTFEQIPLGEVLKAIPGWSMEVRGVVAGKAEFRTPYAKISDPAAWSASAELTAPALVVAGRNVKGLRVTALVAGGSLTFKDTAVTVENVPITAEATLALGDKYAFAATVRTTGTDVTDLRKLVPEAELPAPIEGVLVTETHVTGTVSPFTFAATGQITATKLTLAKSSANHVEVKWQATREKLVVSELKAKVFGGSLSGSADVPFAPDKSGTFELAFKNLDAGAATELVPDFPVRIEGQVSGKVGGAIAPAKPGQSRIGKLDVDLTAPKLTVQGIPAERLVGKAAIAGGVFEYQLEGKTLGGSFEVKGRYPGQKKEKGAAEDRGSFTLTGLDLARVAPELGLSSVAQLRGRVDASFAFDNDLSTGSGRVVLTGLRWGDAMIARELSGVLVLRDGILSLTDLNGRFAGGELRTRAQIHLKDRSRNYFSISLTSADAKRLFAPIPDLAGAVDGPVSIVVRGHLGRELRGSGSLTMPRGTISGVAVADLRIPFDWATAAGGYGRVAIRDAAVQTGTGKAEANLTLEWGVEARVEGVIRFTNVPLRAISSELGSSSLFGNGRITGRFELGGQNVRSVNDLTGNLVATLNQTSVKEIPLLQQTVPFLNPSGLVKPFQAGDVHGSLSRGVFRVQRLALANPAAQLFAEGTITLAGRVDMNVVGHTGLIGPESRAMRLFGLQLPAIGPIPLSLIQNVSDFLSNRTIRLSITGSVKDPVVRVNTAALLTDEAVRFLLSSYLPTNVAAGLGLSAGFGSTSVKK